MPSIRLPASLLWTSATMFRLVLAYSSSRSTPRAVPASRASADSTIKSKPQRRTSILRYPPWPLGASKGIVRSPGGGCQHSHGGACEGARFERLVRKLPGGPDAPSSHFSHGLVHTTTIKGAATGLRTPRDLHREQKN